MYLFLMSHFLLGFADMEPLSMSSLVPQKISDVEIPESLEAPPKTKYVDPRTYPSLADAMSQVGVQEMSSEDLSKLDEIGCGEPCFCL